MNKLAKVWGCTSLLFARNSVELHRIEGNKGHQCSEHRHIGKWNRFFVESGYITIRIWWDDMGTRSDTYLKPLESCDVPPGLWHQFRVDEDCVAYEFYWAALESNDIERRTQGA